MKETPTLNDCCRCEKANSVLQITDICSLCKAVEYLANLPKPAPSQLDRIEQKLDALYENTLIHPQSDAEKIEQIRKMEDRANQ